MPRAIQRLLAPFYRHAFLPLNDQFTQWKHLAVNAYHQIDQVVSSSPATCASAAAVVLIGLRILRSTDEPPEVTLHTLNAVAAFAVDGDTIELNDGTRVRLSGIDTPERLTPRNPADAELADAANAWLHSRIAGRPVKVVSESTRTDRYGRITGWIFDDRDALVNEEIIQLGFSKLVVDYGLPESLEPRLRRAEAIARAKRAGLWAD
ncbi:MAG: thermonuclease family protein [Planctomyces sp.]|nr:thermonuclease family protein [Planctomyces sp.]